MSDDELCRILSSADLGVDPDPKNDWSDKSTMNKIMEYMFFGLPVVAYELTEHRVSAGPAALFAEPNCEGALARSISELLDAAAWAKPAARGCARSWPGSTRHRCSWPPTTGFGRHRAVDASSSSSRRRRRPWDEPAGITP